MQASDLYSILPPGFRYRELWLPELINNHATLPSLVSRGHGLTLTGAQKGTTCEGVHFDGSATSNINCGAIHNAAPKLWISFRFKLDQAFAAGSAEQDLVSKFSGWNEYLLIFLHQATGALRFALRTGATDRFALNSAEVSWQAGVWYHVLASISDTAGIGRLIINNDAPILTGDVNPAPNAGNFIIGDLNDGAGQGIKGIISDVFVGTDDLTVAEEVDLYKGIPPADVVEEYLLDEGRGVTANNRGSSGVGVVGTLDTSCTWAWGRVKQPVLSLDGINDRAVSSLAEITIQDPLTLVWAAKAKSTYSSLPVYTVLAMFYNVITGDFIRFFYTPPGNTLDFAVSMSGGGSASICIPTKPAIDDYVILIGTLSNEVIGAYTQGALVEQLPAPGIHLPAGNTRAFIGIAQDSASYPDISKPLMLTLIDGAFTARDAYTKSLVKRFDLPIAV